MKERLIKLNIDVSTRALDKTPSFALKAFEYTLMSRLPDLPEYPAYSEAIKELHSTSSYQLRRLAMRNADYFSVSQDKAKLFENASLIEKSEGFL